MTSNNPFTNIIHGIEPGIIIHQDDNQRFALIANNHPEAAVHWLAIPYEEGTTENLEQSDRNRFLDLIDYAINTTKAQVDQYPILQQGFSIKFHCGAFETIEHPKLHILSTE
jgi:diadenosine tetraphosphate (Ap4A) HIT family hydrolase